MNSLKTRMARLLILAGVFLLLPMSVYAWEPGDKELDAAINSGDLAGYFANISAWLDRKTPAEVGKITEAAMTDLLKDPVFANTLDQRQFIEKHGVEGLSKFAKADEASKKFLAWVLKDTEKMNLYLEAATPSRDDKRQLNDYKIGVDAVARWKQLYTDDPDTHEGTLLRLAMAFALAPPGGTAYASGLPKEWLPRYKHYKAAYLNKELVPSFADLPVCDYGKVIHSWGSDKDLAWGRKMVNAWRPDLMEKDQIPLIVSEVWRRFSPIPFKDFAHVLAGGGKCGPRAFFGAFICNAVGMPAIGVGQPAHACFAAKSAHPEMEPQPGSVWKVYQGRGWQVSDCGDAMYGPQWLAEMTLRYRVAEFSTVEHMRWLASTLPSKERADCLRELARKFRKPVNTTNPLGVPADSIDAVAGGMSQAQQAADAAQKPVTLPEEPIKAPAGVIHVEAEAFVKSFAEPAYPNEQKGEVHVFNCRTGGKQVYFQRNMKLSWVEYDIDAPAAGTYGMELMVAVANVDQVLDVGCGADKLGTIKLPWTTGLWQKTAPVDIELKKGKQILRISAPMERGISFRWFELTPKVAK